jgi:hypothetical protein
VNADEAQRHLRLGDAVDLLDLEFKLEQATGIILDYLHRPDEDWIATMTGWTRVTVPRPVQAAVLLQLGELYRFRGDDDSTKAAERGLAPGVAVLLRRFRDPVLS